MQYKNATKIIIDKRKLDILIRLGCPDNQILELIKTGKFTKTGDSLIDETLECLADFKEFKNWGGNHNPNGINGCNKSKKRGQVDIQVDRQDGGQDVDKDIDIDKDLKIKEVNKKEIYKEKFKEETVFIDEHTRIDECMPEFEDMTYDECCRAYQWLQEKMYCQLLAKSKFVEIVRKFKRIK